MRCRAWAIRTGLGHSAIFMSINMINLLGIYTFGAEKFTSETDPVMRGMSLTLFYLAVAVLVAVYVVANISLNASRRSPSPKSP